MFKITVATSPVALLVAFNHQGKTIDSLSHEMPSIRAGSRGVLTSASMNYGASSNSNACAIVAAGD